MEVFGFHVGFISDLEFWRWNSLVVSMFLVLLSSSSDVVLESFVKFSEVDCEVPSTSRCQIAFRMYFQIKMVAFVSEKGGDASSLIWSIVVSKFGKGKERGLVILLIIAILFQSLVYPFSLTVTLRVVSRCEV